MHTALVSRFHCKVPYRLSRRVSTGDNVYSGDRFSGNDLYSVPKTPDDAILFTFSGITAIADKKFRDFIKKPPFLCQLTIFYDVLPGN